MNKTDALLCVNLLQRQNKSKSKLLKINNSFNIICDLEPFSYFTLNVMFYAHAQIIYRNAKNYRKI